MYFFISYHASEFKKELVQDNYFKKFMTNSYFFKS